MSARALHIRIAFTGFIALALAMGVGRFAYTPLLAMMRAEDAITVEDGGWIAGLHFLGYLMGAYCAARVPLSPRTVLRTSLAVIGIATAAMGPMADPIVWGVFRWACGVTSAWTLVVVGNYFVRYLTESGGAAFQGIVFSGVGGGIALVGLACMVFMLNETASPESWRWIGGVSLALGIVICLKFGAELPARRASPAETGQARSPLAWPLLIAYAAAGLGYIVPATYLPLMARALVSDPLVFGWSWPVFGFAACLSTLLAAAIQRRFSNRRIWAGSQIVLGCGILLPAFVSNIAVIVVSGAMVGGTFMIITMVGMKEAHRIAPETDVMRHIAMMTTAFALGQMIGPVLGSALYGSFGGFGPALLLTGVAVLFSTVLLAKPVGQAKAAEHETLP